MSEVRLFRQLPVMPRQNIDVRAVAEGDPILPLFVGKRRSGTIPGKPPKGCRRRKTKVAQRLKVAKGLSTAHNDSYLAYILRPLFVAHNGPKAGCKSKIVFKTNCVCCAQVLRRVCLLKPRCSAAPDRN